MTYSVCVYDTSMYEEYSDTSVWICVPLLVLHLSSLYFSGKSLINTHHACSFDWNSTVAAVAVAGYYHLKPNINETLPVIIVIITRSSSSNSKSCCEAPVEKTTNASTIYMS